MGSPLAPLNRLSNSFASVVNKFKSDIFFFVLSPLLSLYPTPLSFKPLPLTQVQVLYSSEGSVAIPLTLTVPT